MYVLRLVSLVDNINVDVNLSLMDEFLQLLALSSGQCSTSFMGLSEGDTQCWSNAENRCLQTFI